MISTISETVMDKFKDKNKINTEHLCLLSTLIPYVWIACSCVVLIRVPVRRTPLLDYVLIYIKRN